MSPWIRVGRLTFRRRMALAASGSIVFATLYTGVLIVPQLSTLLVPDMPLLLRLLAAATIGLALSLAGLAVAASLTPGVQVREDGSEIRVRRRISPAADLDRATILAGPPGRDRRDLVLDLRVGGRATRLWLRSRDRVLLDDEERAVLTRAIERSSIAPPVSEHDPSGRFARYNFPGSLTKEEALNLVRDPPMPGDPLPTID